MSHHAKKQKPQSEDLVNAAVDLFERTFEGRKPVVIARAPGRVNLIGEHTDYSEGFCFPIAISLSTVCCLGKAPDPQSKTCTLASMQSPGETISFNVKENAEEEWGKYIAGVAAQYNLDFPVEASFASDVPLGGGLSSSAALDVSFATALERLLDPKKAWDPSDRALKCVEGDHTFVGVVSVSRLPSCFQMINDRSQPCGIMDQFASSCCREGHALLIDCRGNAGRLVSFSDPAICFVVTNTNIKHSHSGGEYGARVRECKEASAELHVRFLRDVTDVSLTDKLKNETVRKRARHVVSENARTLLAAEAAEAKDWTRFGTFMNESHASLTSDFEVSSPELDFLSATARAFDGVYGSRMTGGGFGGCIVSLVKREQADPLVKHLDERYTAEFPSLHCTSYIFLNPGSGASIVE